MSSKIIRGKKAETLDRAVSENPRLSALWERIKEHPVYTTNFIRLGEELVRLGRWPEACVLYEFACRHHPRSYNLMVKLGKVQTQAGKEAAAIKTYQKTIKVFPDRFKPYLFLEKLYRAGHHPELAVKLYEEIPDHNPVKEKTRYRLFALFARQARYDQAIRVLRGAIKDYGESFSRCLELGKLNFRQRNFLGAVQSFQSAAAFQPDNLKMRVWLGVALKELGNLDLAEYEFNEVLRLKAESYQGLIHLAELKMKTGDHAAARAYLNRVDRVAPHNARALICRGWMAYEEGDWEKAVRRCEDGLKETYAYYVWEQVLAHRILAAAAVKLGNKEDAEFHRMMAEAIAGKDTYESLIGLAEALIRGKKFRFACRAAGRVLELFPRNTRARIVEAEACLKEGRLDRAVEVCRATLVHIPAVYVREKIRAHTVIALACKKSGDLAQYRQHKKQIYSLIREIALHPPEKQAIKATVTLES